MDEVRKTDHTTSASDVNNKSGKQTSKAIHPKSDKPRIGRIAGPFGIVIFGLITIIILCISALSIWLSPDRLAGIAQREADRYLNADLYTGEIKFTFWSSFPHLHVEVDSISIVSRTLRSLPQSQREALPGNPDFLASARSFSGGINILRLLIDGEVSLTDVSVDRLRLNCVAVNDSVTNYNIIKVSDNKPISIPRIRARSITLTHPRRLSYYSAATNTFADILFSDAVLKRVGKKGDDYRMLFKGLASVNSDRLEVLNKFPFTFDGIVKMEFKPFGMTFNDYTINLGNTRGKMNLALKLGDDIKVKDFKYSLSSVDLMRLAQYLPSAYLPEMERINANVAVDMEARLLKPYRYSPSTLPSIAVDMTVPRGTVTYSVSDNSSYSVDNINMDASFIFNGDNPDDSYFNINNLSMSGYGATLSLHGNVSDLTTNPKVQATVNGQANLGIMSSKIRELAPYNISGEMAVNSDISFRLSSLSDPQVNKISVKGDVILSDYALNPTSFPLDIEGDMVRLNFSTMSNTLSVLDLDNSDIKVLADASELRYKGNGTNIKGKRMRVDCNLHGFNINAGKPVDGVITAADIYVSRPKDSLDVALHNSVIKGSVTESAKGFESCISLSSALSEISLPEADLRLKNINSSFILSPLSGIDHKFDYASIHKDSLVLDAMPHTAEYLKFDAPQQLRQLIDRWRMEMTLSASDGQLKIDGSPSNTGFSNISIAAGNDYIDIHSLHVDLDRTPLDLKGRVDNLHAIICSGQPVEIPVKLTANLGTVNINDIAYDYEAGVKRRTNHDYYTKVRHKDIPVVSNDSIAFLIPRNLRADLRVSAKETVYTNLHLYNLATGIRIEDGDANIDYLNIDSDFGKAAMKFDYFTSDIENMKINANVRIDDINLVEFFKNFHTLLLMMPEMKNLTGDISAELDGSVDLFPTMYINSPSLTASASVHGRNLQVHQNPFIRHITKMLLIRNDNDLSIKNMDVSAEIHDNLLTLFPFNFEFENYKINMMGVNNFNGDIYYHIGVLESPLHFPFGINIEGLFHHPEFRFGGARYKAKNAWRVTDNTQGEYRFNLTKELKYFAKEFMHKAAQAAVDPDISL